MLYILTIFFHSYCLYISSALAFFFREKKLWLKETFSHLIRRGISGFLLVKVGENCFCIFSCLCHSSSRRIWFFFANPDKIPQKIKNFQIVLCSLKLVLIIQLDIQDICQTQCNFKTLQEANRFIENYEIETFSKFSVFQKDAGFQNKGLCITKLFKFL